MIKEDNCTRERQTVNKWDIKKKKKDLQKYKYMKEIEFVSVKYEVGPNLYCKQLNRQVWDLVLPKSDIVHLDMNLDTAYQLFEIEELKLNQ